MKRFLLSLLLVLPVWAALPPQSPEDLKAEADLVVTATVTDVSKRSVELEAGYTNTVYEVDLKVDKVEKGKMTGSALLVTCWTPENRPEGWVGPQGQNEIPKSKERGRFYLRDVGEGAYEILEPNGWSAL